MSFNSMNSVGVSVDWEIIGRRGAPGTIPNRLYNRSSYHRSTKH
jgi:hypothetical protein